MIPEKMLKISIGTNRLVLIGKDKVYKIPVRIRGYKANLAEYYNSWGKPYVADTRHKYGINIQERLQDIQIFPLTTSKEDIPQELQHLFEHKLRNRMQVGKSADGSYKFFDYEDIKADKV